MGLLRLSDSLPRPVRRALRWVPGSARLRRVLTGTPRGPAPAPGTPRPVVYLPTWARWDTMRQRPQYLLAAFAAAGHPVFFVDPRERTTRVVDGVTIVRSLRDVPRAHALLYMHFAPLWDLVERFDRPVVVYDLLDDLSIYDADEAHSPRSHTVRSHHAEIVRSADLVIASAPALVDRHRTERGDIVLVGNGVDVPRFAEPRPRPDDLPAGDVVVGYHGAIARWFDVDLLERVARASPRWEFVLVGPVLPEAADAVTRLEGLPNVHLLGERPSDDIPAYVQAFDVSVIWFVVDHLTAAVSPLKLFESLAAGVPVVSTPLPACVGVPGVSVADTPAGMTTAIAEAFAGRSTGAEERRRTAEGASWDARLRPVLDRLEELDLQTVPG